MSNSKSIIKAEPRSRRGAILVIFALTFTGLILFLGLVVDGGIIYFERRKAQAAADAGAYSGALELLHNNDSWVADSAKADTKINGFDDDENSVVITVNNPPVSVAAVGDSNAVEVIVQSTVKTTLMQLVADGSSIVRARAVAAVGPETGPMCILALNESAEGAIVFNGTVDMNVPKCEIVTRSNHEEAIEFNGTPCVTAATIGYGTGGGYNGTTANGSCIDPEPIGIIPPDDPYANLTPPDPADYTEQAASVTNRTNGSAAEGFLAGVYRGGIRITGGGPYTFAPGMYIVDGLNVSGGSMYGDGVTFYNTGDGLRNIEITGNAYVEFSAPANTGSDYDNILFYNSKDVGTQPIYDAKLVGSSGSTFDGVLYFPTVELEFGGNQDATEGVFTQVIADTVFLHGRAQVSGNYGDSNSGRTPTTTRVSFIE